MKVNVNTINKLLELHWSGNTVITEARYFPQFTHNGNEWVQQETYEVKYKGNRPNYHVDILLKKYLNVTLIYEEDVIPLIPYKEQY